MFLSQKIITGKEKSFQITADPQLSSSSYSSVGCSCPMESAWHRSVKRKIDEIEGGAGRSWPQIPAAKTGEDGVSARVEVENEVSALREALVSQQLTIQDLTLELEEERNAASTAASEAMSMILRLQREKAEVQMEFRQFKRFAEERMAHDQQELVTLDDLLFKREQAFQSQTCEINAYKHRLVSYGIDSSDPEPHTPQNSNLLDYDYLPLRCTIPRENFGDDYGNSMLEKYTPTTLQHLQNLDSRIYEIEAETGAVVGPDSELVRDLEEEFAEDFPGGDEQPSEDEENARIYTIDAVHPVPMIEASNEEEEEGEERVEDKRENAAEGGDIKMLYMRLQALEADRESMRQAIISVRTEKAQLVLLKEIAQQLCKEAVPERRRRFSFVAMIKLQIRDALYANLFISFLLHPVGTVLRFLERESISKQVFVWYVKQQLWFTAPLKQNVLRESVAKSSCLAACIS